MIKKSLSFKGDTFAVLKKFSGKSGLFFLDSSLRNTAHVHSYIGFSPVKVIVGKNLNQLCAVLQGQRKLKAKAVGYIGYEGDFHFGLYQQWLAINHKTQRITIHAATQQSISNIVDILEHAPTTVPVIQPQRVTFKSNFNKTAYVNAVKHALEAITRGDIYQINLSRVIQANVQIDPMALYAALRTFSPSPFAAYYDCGDKQILSSSPERFLKLDQGIVSVKPMKGTRPRGKTKAEDTRLREDLKHSAKEIAELLMVTDLERNDLGRVCDYGSVKVTSMRTIERYKTVFQATATIEGKLHKDYDTLDLIKATFPSGSVTGCPKIAAMKLIKKIEKAPRGFYTGAFGYIDSDGNMDLSVLIRSMLVTKKNIRYHVGGGIVADSNPAQEYAETTLKAKAMEQAIRSLSK